MGRALLLCVACFAAGAAATYAVMSRLSASPGSAAPAGAPGGGLAARLPAAATQGEAAPSARATQPVRSGFPVPPSLAAAIGQPTDFSQTVATYVLAADADELRLRGLIAEADGMRHQGDRAAVLAILFSRYGEIDPRAALAHLDEIGLSPKANLLFAIFHSWSKVDLGGAIAAVHTRSDGTEQVIAGDGILRAYEERGNDVLNDIRSRLPSADDDAPQSLNDIFRLVASDPEAAVERVLRVNSSRQTQVLTAVGGQWASRDPEAAYAYSARIQDPTLRDWYKRGVFYAWSERDPQRVIAILNEGLSREDQTLIVNAAISAMANADPQATFEHARAIEDEAVQDAAFRVLMRAWAPSDPTSAARAVEGLDSEPLRQQLAGTVVTSLVQEAPDAALDWARRLDGGHGATWQAALQAIAQTEPQVAIDHAFSLASAAERDQSLMSVFGGLAQSSPETAAHYWPQLPDEATRTTTAMQITGEWARRDPGAAERWVLGLPPGPARDRSLAQLAAAGSYGPLDSARLINAIADEDQRAAALYGPLRALARSSRADAEALLDRVALSAQRRQELEQLIRTPGR